MKETNTAREWLEQEFKKRRAKNSRYSLRMMAQQLNIPSGRFSEILKGKRRVTPKMAMRIADRMSLTPQQREKFLLKTAKINTVENRTADYKQLSIDSFYLIADWYHFAIINLLNLNDFKSEPKWIARRLGISVVETSSAIERMKRLSLIEEVDGILKSTDANLTTTHDIDSVALRMSHKQTLHQAIQSLDDVPTLERDITSISMAIDTAKLPLAKEMITRFRRTLCAVLEDSSHKNEVYNLNIQLVPVTKKI